MNLQEAFDRESVRLAACTAAANGSETTETITDYAYSATFSDVVALRKKFEAAEEALKEIGAVASGERQVAIDDTEGMAWVDKRTREYFKGTAPTAATPPA